MAGFERFKSLFNSVDIPYTLEEDGKVKLITLAMSKEQEQNRAISEYPGCCSYFAFDTGGNFKYVGIYE